MAKTDFGFTPNRLHSARPRYFHSELKLMRSWRRTSPHSHEFLHVRRQMWGLVIDSEAFGNIERHLQRLIYHQKCYSSMMDGRKQLSIK